ncbi:MAG: hypothetical protein IPF46_12950 [Saprospiraceae bacterium]|nr:hypothetical protein [Candidatus Vicinibacter affinis]MBK6821559.1 hypothetical protein [Candidatus Vicinibacter affinis]MBK7303214.1 hypothetical protein [Candidatus Vicinibacter affinis]MBK7695101.1 hypothetical protein [Candidatus Vicinibacter affinis]MBK7800007.1 hypothetical protein [Candidatus Vicinibacter affinis]
MTENNENQFIRGFNQGYVLAQFEPDVLTLILKNYKPINSYFSGLSFGQKEFILDQTFNAISYLRKSKTLEKDSR